MRDPPSPLLDKPDCSVSSGPPLADILGGVLAGGLSLAALSALGSLDEGSGNALLAIAGGSAVVSIGFFWSAYVGSERGSNCRAAHVAWRPAPKPAAPPVDQPLVEVVFAKDGEAAQLTRAAHDAAADGRCAPTAAAGPRVELLDREYYEKVFLADLAIARCR